MIIRCRGTQTGCKSCTTTTMSSWCCCCYHGGRSGAATVYLWEKSPRHYLTFLRRGNKYNGEKLHFKSTNTMVTIGNAHHDLIHDAVLDYYGRRLATCSSDKTIKIFEIDGDNHKLITTLTNHEGPVWQVAWAHPKFGSILASCSYDGTVLIWKEDQMNQWSIISEYTSHQASVNSVSWAPHELGAVLLCSSSDGNVSVVDFNEDGTTSHVMFKAHAIGANAASWAPVSNSNTNGKDPLSLKSLRRFVTCGSDNLAKIWKFDATSNTYVEEAQLHGHTDWVRDVDWSPSILLRSYIATASQDKTVLIWTQDGNGTWQKQPLTEEKFADVCWRCSWSLSGNILAVSGGDNRVSLWKENLQGKWESAGEVDQ